MSHVQFRHRGRDGGTQLTQQCHKHVRSTFYPLSPQQGCSSPATPASQVASLRLSDPATPAAFGRIALLPSSPLRMPPASSGSSASLSEWNAESPTPSVAPASLPHEGRASAPRSPTLWRPGSTSYPVVRQVLDPLASKQELHMIYDRIPEISYDLSLRDLVDPSYSINGDHKDIVTESEEWDSLGCSTRQSMTSAVTRRLSLNVPFPSTNSSRSSVEKNPPKVSSPGIGLWTRRLKHGARSGPGLSPKSLILEATTGKQRNSVISPSTSSRSSGRDDSFPVSPHDSPIKITNTFKKECSRSRRSCFDIDIHTEVVDCQQRGPFITSKVPLSNQCSSCSSYTSFFKTHCTIFRKSWKNLLAVSYQS